MEAKKVKFLRLKKGHKRCKKWQRMCKKSEREE